jgi:ribosomal protein S6
MNKYEFVFLIKEAEGLKELKELFSSLAGKILSEKGYGKKKLAYSIGKQGTADRYEWIIEIESDKISEFKKKLGFNDKILRHLLFKIKSKSEKVKRSLTSSS